MTASSTEPQQAPSKPPVRPLGISDLPAIPALADPQISPDGTKIAYTVTTVDSSKDGYSSAIWLVDTAGAEAARVLSAGPRDSAPRWSPDGARLAFVGVRGEGSPQLHVLDLAGGEAHQLGELPGGATDPQWSPDGTRIAVGSLLTLAQSTDPHAPIALDRLLYRADGAGMIGDRRAHLYIVDVASGATRQLTAGDFSISDQRWSPDGTTIAYVAATGADSDLTASTSVFTVAATGGTPLAITPAGAMLATPTWFADGQQLLVTGQESLRAGHTKLFVVPATGGALKPVAQLDRNVMVGGPGYPGGRPIVLEDSTILFLARDGGSSHVYSASPDGAPVKILGSAQSGISGISIGSQRLAYIVADESSNGEIYVSSIDGSVQARLTHHFASALPDVELPVAEARSWSAPDGTTVHGWTLRPRDAVGPTPLLLDIHGGPHNAWSPAFDGVHLYHQELVARGWTVLLLNPRASDGYGEDFFTATVGRWGLLDEQDFLAPIDALVAEGLVDPDRLVVTGYSYGGYMSCWLSARHPDRWAAAIPGGVVVDQQSLAGVSDLGALMASVEFGGDPWERAAEFRASSPYTYVSDVKAPTLLLHGDGDDRCPIGQSEQWFAALRTRRVPVELVRYPGGSHLFILNGRPSHRADWCERIVEWATRHTSGDAVNARRLASRTAGLRARLEQLCAEHSVPGAAVTVLHGDEVVTYTTGVRSLTTKEPVTANTSFQIGSNTKLYTATLVMQLVDKGVVSLDEPVVTYLPEFTLADPSAARSITVRHLLTHTSGIPGDVLGGQIPWGDDAKRTFLSELAGLEPVHPAGELWSYCNAGWVVLGRLVETVTGLPFARAWRELLIDPLGASRTRALPQEIMLLEAALGHVPGPEGIVADSAYATAPASFSAGSLPVATGEDVVRFLRLHLDGGRGPSGEQLLSADTVALMQQPQAQLPVPRPTADSWGLGWSIGHTLDGRRIIGHGGATSGQFSTLQVIPDERLAVVVLTNGPGGIAVGDTLVREVFAELADAELAAPVGPPAVVPDLELGVYVGQYTSGPTTLTVSLEDQALSIEMRGIGLDGQEQVITAPLSPVDATTFLMGPGPAHFLEPDTDGRPRYFFAGRAYRRTGE